MHSPQALKFCIDKWDVDLIVIPFGFRQPVSGIDLEIKRGHAKGKLIMAAANFFSTLTSRYHLSFPAAMPGVMAIAAVDGLGRLRHPIFPPPYSPSVEFSTLGLCVPDFEDDETAPSWRPFEGRGGSAVAVVVSAALLCNAWKYTWCIVPDLPGLVTWCKMPFTREGSRTLLRLMSRKCDTYSFIAPWFLWNSEVEHSSILAQFEILDNLLRLDDSQNSLVTK